MPQIEISGLRYTYPEHSFQVEIDRQSFDSPLTAIVGQIDNTARRDHYD